VLSIDQTKALLAAVERLDPELVPFMVIGLFAGVRPAESSKLTRAEVGDHIHIGKGKSKIGEQRYTSISENLRC
jgi:hypothetical protein